MANVLLSGAIPPQVRPILFGANLIALRKPHGGVRPIAIGNTLRRIVAKAVNNLMFDSFGGKLRPVQLGCGTKAGCEAAVHASRSFLANASEDAPRVLLKLDFQNAFNSVRRDSLLTVVKEDFPHLYPFIWQAYSAPSNLFFGCHSLSSSTGVQQGEPLGPALFSLAIHSLITSLTSDLNLWYLDDGTIGGNVNQVLSDFETIRRLSPTLGLHLNIDKCELVTVGMDSSATLLHFQETAPLIRYVAYNNAMLLGAPLCDAAISLAFQPKIESLKRLTSRLRCLHAHDAIYLLRNCLAIPRLLYLLRSSPSWKARKDSEEFDEIVRLSLQSISNVKMDESAWSQATLPTSKGGLGIRRSVDLALPAFLASSHVSHDLVSSMLPSGEQGIDSLMHEAMDLWETLAHSPLPPVEFRGQQRFWDSVLSDKLWDDLYESYNDPATKARLLSTSTKEAGAWLNVLPVPHLGTKLDDTSIRIAIGLRLGANIVEEHKCICGALVDRNGIHGLSCRRSNGRFPRHQAANETIRRALVSGGVPSILEPVGVCREDAKRPDGMTLIPWEDGRPLLWDFTSCNTLAQSHRARAERGPGVVANFAEDQKCRKYASLTPSYIFAPVCIESLGAWGDNAKAFIRKIGRRVKEVSGEPRSTSFLIQRLALEVQRGNATSVLGTIPASRDWSEVGLLPT